MVFARSRVLCFAGLAVLARGLGCRPSGRAADTTAARDAASHDTFDVDRYRCAYALEHGVCSMYAVSLIELIARPERFDGKRVRVEGFVNFEFEGNGLYLTREDWQRGMMKNGLWIDPPEIPSGIKGRPRWNRRDVLVEATFDAAMRGHLGMWSGALVKVTRLDTSSSEPPRPDEIPPEGQ